MKTPRKLFRPSILGSVVLGSAVLSSVLAPGTALADSDRDPSAYGPYSLWYLLDGPDSGWYYEAGVGVEYEPTYTGSDDYSTEPGFNFRAIYKPREGRLYSISLGEIGAVFKFNDDLLLSTVLEYEAGRDSSDDPILTGLPNQDDTVEAQITLAKRWGPWSLSGILQPDLLGRGKGFVYFAALGYDTELSDRSRLGISLDVSGANQEYFQTEIGITQQGSINSDLPVYTPGSGYKSSTLSIGYHYEFNDRWSIVTTGAAEFYGSTMGDSPLIANGQGDKTNLELAMTLRYQW